MTIKGKNMSKLYNLTVSSWMWYIFPQFDGLGYSKQAEIYAIKILELMGIEL
jgi:uncharacterized protein (DUF1810 family)